MNDSPNTLSSFHSGLGCRVIFRRSVVGVFLSITSERRTRRTEADVICAITTLGDSASIGFVIKILSGEIPKII